MSCPAQAVSWYVRRLPYDEAWPAEIAVASPRDDMRILPGVPGTYCGSQPAACQALKGLSRVWK